MTFPSRKKRRITAWSTAILISLGGSALAQTPRADTPAPTSWAPYTPPLPTPTPPVPLPTTSTPPKVTVPDLPPLPEVVQPPKMVNAQKPSNENKTQPVKPREAAPSLPSRAPAIQPIPIPTQPLQAVPVATPSAEVEAKPALMTRPQTMLPPRVPPAPAVQPYSASALLPDRNSLFRLDSDATLNARIIKELDKGEDRFPVAASLSPPQVKYEPKSYSPSVLLREPNYVIHRRLYFEEKNSERGLWDAGPAQGVFSSLYFYRDVLLFPGKFASGCKTPYDSSAGKCMPGDPTPYYCYPPSEITLFGGFVEGAVITGFAIILP